MFDFTEMLKEQSEKMGFALDDTAAEVPGLPSLEELTQSLMAMQERMRSALDMPAEALAELPDEALFEAVYARIAEKDELNYTQQIFSVVSEYDMEMQNGGLWQYFANSVNAPMLEEALAAIGAEEHRAYFHSFIQKNNIDVQELSAFSLEDNGDWEMTHAAQMEQYPFDAYDEGFYSMPGVQAALLRCVREHLKDF